MTLVKNSHCPTALRPIGLAFAAPLLLRRHLHDYAVCRIRNVDRTISIQTNAMGTAQPADSVHSLSILHDGDFPSTDFADVHGVVAGDQHSTPRRKRPG